ncbi:MAG: DM13 domain-containing protein [Actinomycetota bacterium]|nr:DM13 domain-containing protein [Actinomycetota bacterium]
MTTTPDGPPEPAPAGPPGRRWWDWLLGALPALAFLATFGFFFLDRNREARTVFKSSRGILTVAAIFVGYFVVAVVIRRLARRAWVAPLVLTVVILGLAAWIVRPYYVDETADRRLAGPVGEGPRAVAPADDAGVPSASPAPPAAQRIGTGRLQGIGHDASGGVSLIRSPDGLLVVRFESFDIEGTPDPRVHLLEGSDKRSPGGVTLGRLHGNRGQVLDYPVPAGSGAGPGWTVLVWCRSFSVPIANATLATT